MPKAIKRLSKRYRNTQIKIIKSILTRTKKYQFRVPFFQIAKDAGITRQGLFYHGDLNALVPEFIDYLMAEFTEYLSKQKIKDDLDDQRHNRRVFTIWFIFSRKYKREMMLVCSTGLVSDVIWRMLKLIYPLLIIRWLPASQPTPSVESERVGALFYRAGKIMEQWAVSTKVDLKRARPYLLELIRLIEEVAAKPWMTF